MFRDGWKKESWKESILQRINQEGFDYTFIHYSDWKEVKDKKFQKALKKYIKAHLELVKVLEIKDF